MSDTHNLALTIINDGASYPERCKNHATMTAKKFAGYARGLVIAESLRQRRTFQVKSTQKDIEQAVVDLIDHHDRARDEEQRASASELKGSDAISTWSDVIVSMERRTVEDTGNVTMTPVRTISGAEQ